VRRGECRRGISGERARVQRKDVVPREQAPVPSPRGRRRCLVLGLCLFAYGNCWPAERGIYITAPSAGVTATALAAGGTHTCAIVTGGGVKCWGSNNQGQLGAGNTVEQPGMVVDVGFGTGALSSPPSSPGTVEHPILMVTVVSLGPGTAVQWAR
jgi:hypothetical protein